MSPDTPDAQPDLLEPDDLRAAGEALRAALYANGVHARLAVGRTADDDPVSVTVLLSDGFLSISDDRLPAADPAAALQSWLGQHGVRAHTALDTVGPDCALRVTLPTAEDARQLAVLVAEQRSERHRAALQLRRAFSEAGITDHRIFVHDGLIQIGDIRVDDALTLYDILTDHDRDRRTDTPAFDRWEWRNWHAVECLADLLGPVLSRASGQELRATAVPSCRDCITNRPHRIALGAALPPQAVLLAEAVARAAGTPPEPTRPAARHGSGQCVQ